MQRPFVIHIHSGWGQEHYDLMIQEGQALSTWQFTVPLQEIGKMQELSAIKLDDHRSEYLSYQGPVSKGRGEVKFCDRGNCDVVSQAAGRWEVVFTGRILRGRFELVRQERQKWTLRRLCGA